MTYKPVIEYDAYYKISLEKEQFGRLRKTLVHIHTPISHDYRMLSKWKVKDFKNSTTDDLKKILVNLICDKNITEDVLDFGKVFHKYRKYFSNEKELVSYVILAAKIIINNVEQVVVADHNTIDGCRKLEIAIDIYKEMYNNSCVYPNVIYGIEISCADKIHVVGIFDKKNKNVIQNYLDNIIIDKKYGTYETSLSVLKKFNIDFKEFAYIAHANSANIFKKSYMANGYKNKLFESGFLTYIGVSDEIHKDKMEKMLRSNLKSSNFQIILDNDGHFIEELDSKFLWINGEKLGIDLFKEAMIDFDISVFLHENDVQQKNYIEGIYIKNISDSSLAFLKSNEEDFVMKFSPSLNCLIGGRGTGKSTVLQLIEYVFNQHCENDKKLEFICSHGAICILYYLNGKEYLLSMNMPQKSSSKHIYQYFDMNPNDKYGYVYRYNQSIDEFAYKNNLKIYEVKLENGIPKFKICNNKKDVLHKMFNVSYAVNDLVNTASDNKIQQFIFSTMFDNQIIKNQKHMIRKINYSDLENILVKLNNYKEKRKNEISEIIDPFNKEQEGLLRITYKQTNNYNEPDLYRWIFGDRSKNKMFNGYRITRKDIINYLLSIFDKEGLCELFNMLYNRNIDIKKYSLKEYAKDLKANKNLDFKEVDNSAEIRILNSVYNEFKNINLNLIKEYLIDFLNENEELSLEFNINSKNSSASLKETFKDVKHLSLGQKVVAMLDFILAYSEYSNDYRPLIIDQPEDNLDSQYIYKNLVKQIRSVKSKRQIIIATHNAALVTNTLSEHVCVMKSDGNHGWIEAEGYPGTKKIKRHIVNYMEGGKESFKHKMKLYEEIL